MAEFLLVGRNFVSGICKLRPKNLRPIFVKKILGIYLPALPERPP